MKRKIALCLLAGIIFSALSACSIQEVDELYSLPQPSQEYLQLQNLIDAEIAAGSEYSAPTAGSQRQSVQLTDLDGDGVNEALAFFTRNESPKICIYRKSQGGYVQALAIVGDGTGCGRVEYADLDGDGFSEILISWRTSSDMKLIKAYSVKNWTSTVLLTTSCTDFQIGDLNGNGTADIALLKFEQGAGTLDLYSVEQDGELLQSSAKLSSSLTDVERFRVGELGDGAPAVFIEGQYTDEENNDICLTDIIVCIDAKLKNITMASDGTDSDTKRSYQVYCTDIDGNGTMEVPIAEKVFMQPGSATESYVFDWYAYGIDGERSLCASTYHCEADGWFVVLPEQWREGFTVRRETAVLSGERAVVLSQASEEDGVTDLITIYALSGENRRDRAKIAGRFVLLQGETVIYVAKPPAGTEFTEKQRRELADSFHLIYTEWNTGAV